MLAIVLLLHAAAIIGVRREIAWPEPIEPTQTTLSIALLKAPPPPVRPVGTGPPQAAADPAHALTARTRTTAGCGGTRAGTATSATAATRTGGTAGAAACRRP